MIDFVREVKHIALHLEGNNYVSICMSTDVEVAWHSVDLHITLHLASHFLVELFPHLLKHVVPVLDVVQHGLL